MAIRYKDLYDKEVARELSGIEFASIDAAERFIDAKILEQWQNRAVYIPLSIAIFKSYVTGATTDYSDIAREKMFTILKNRYEEADWTCVIDIDNSGSMNSCDYWKLTPKKQKV